MVRHQLTGVMDPGDRTSKVLTEIEVPMQTDLLVKRSLLFSSVLLLVISSAVRQLRGR